MEVVNNRKSLRRWELLGIIPIILVGSMLHFVFEWSGELRPVAVIAAVNESTWEHLKIAFWPALIYALVEYPFLRKQTNNFAIAKAIGIYLIPITIIVLFSGYTAVVEDNFIVDITIFIIAIIVGQLVSYKIMTGRHLTSPGINRLGIVLLIIAVAAFSLLTYFAPHFFLFQDPVSGGYGIQ